MTTHRTLVSCLLAATLLLTASSASADPLYKLHYRGTTGVGESVKLHAPGLLADGRTVYAGQMRYRYRGDDFVSYCVDIDSWAGSSPVSELNVDQLNRGDEIAYLFLNEAEAVSDDLAGAALQVAMWELLYEHESQALNVMPQPGDGFSILVRDGNSTDPAVVDAANALLATLGTMPAGWDAGGSVVLLHSECRQDTIVPTGQLPVPEPATMAILGMGGVVLAVRRRRT